MPFVQSWRLVFALGFLLSLGASSEARAQEPSLTEIARAEALIRAQMKRDYQLSRNTQWQVPAVMTGVGLASIVTGALLIIHSDGGVVQISGTRCDQDGVCRTSSSDESPDRQGMFIAGAVLVGVGPLLTVIGVPMFSVRLGRALRVRTLEREIRQHGVELSLAPQIRGRQPTGLAATLRF